LNAGRPQSKFIRTWLSGIVIAILAALVVASIGFAFLIRRRFVQQRDSVREVEQAVSNILGRSRLELEQIPDVMQRITWQAGALLSRVDELETEAKKPVHSANGNDFLASLFTTTIAIVEEVVGILRDHPSSSDTLLAELNLCLQLDTALNEAITTLGQAAASSSRSPEFVRQLERGELDELLTIGPLLNAYFPANAELGIVPAALAAVNRLVCFILATCEVTIRIQRPLSIVDVGTPGIEPFDRREVRRVEPIRERAAREARTLAEGKLLVVDCTRPGWSAPGKTSREPRSTIFDPASWT
jgi:hypothetical protein